MKGWKRSFVGDSVVLTPPGGAAVGRIRVTPRQPLRPLRALVAAEAARLEGATLHGPTPLVTAEGEHAALLHAVTPRVARSIGWVFGDDWLTSVESVCRQAPFFALFRSIVARLTQETCLGLGAQRWRRYFYSPPPGWTGLPADKAAVWLSPRGPSGHGVITVFAARPARHSAATRQHGALFEQLGEGRPTGRVASARTRAGLGAEHVTRIVDGESPLHVTDVVLDDGRYLYPMRLETDARSATENTAIFTALVGSVQMLPMAEAPQMNVSHWVE